MFAILDIPPITSHLLNLVYHGNRYQLMLSCWRSEPQARLSFTQLQYSFKSIVDTGNTGIMSNYITVQPNNSYAFVLLSEPFGDSS